MTREERRTDHHSARKKREKRRDRSLTDEGAANLFEGKIDGFPSGMTDTAVGVRLKPKYLVETRNEK